MYCCVACLKVDRDAAALPLPHTPGVPSLGDKQSSVEEVRLACLFYCAMMLGFVLVWSNCLHVCSSLFKVMC